MTAQEKPQKFTFDQEFPDTNNLKFNTGPTIEQLVEKARAEGFAQGQAQTTQSMQSEFTTHLGRLEEALANIEQAQKTHFQILYKQTLKLTSHLIEKMLHEAAEKFPEDVLAQNVERLLSEINAEMSFTLHVHPATLGFMQNLIENNDTFKKLNMKIQPNATLSLGDCMADWDTGGIDGRLNQLLSETQSLLALATTTPVDIPQEALEEVVEAAEPSLNDENIAPETTEQDQEEETTET